MDVSKTTNMIAAGWKKYSPQSPLNQDIPLATSFDGATDYLSRDTALSGSVDGKIFTLSFFYYAGSDNEYPLEISNRLLIKHTADGIQVTAADSGNTLVLKNENGSIPLNTHTWCSIIISIDLTDTAKRHFIVNDVEHNVNWTYYDNTDINFSNDDDGNIVGGYMASSTVTEFQGRLSHLFLDYTYRDLSIEANRRLFVTADGKPANGLELVDKYLDNKFYAGDNESGLIALGFNDDGTKLYIGGAVNATVYQYTLSTAYVINTATYDDVSYDVSAQQDSISGLSFNTDGTLMFLSCYSDDNDAIYQYDLSTGFDISTASYNDVSFSVADQTTYPKGIDFNQDGTKLYVNAYTDSTIFEYDLSTAFDLSTATYNNVSLVIDTETGIYNGLNITSDGYKMYIVNYSTDYIYEYTLSTQNDISTGVLTNKRYCGDIDTELTNIRVINDGSVLMATGTGGDFVYQYTLSTPYDISTAVYGLPANDPKQPIMYLPLKSGETAHENLGYGGSFVQNGLIMTADRGPSQDNTVMSEFDGEDDYLSSSDIGASDSKTITLSFIAKYIDGGYVLNDARDNGVSPCRIVIDINSFDIMMYDMVLADGSRIATVSYNHFNDGVILHVSCSIDVSDDTKTILVVNGEVVTPKTNDLTDSTDSLLSEFQPLVGGYKTDSVSNIQIGELYFDTNYIDLSVSNPFWDSETNKPISVRKAISDNGLMPLIAMPIDASCPEKNYGTGGDFTLK